MDELEIIGAPQSTYVRMVRIVCEEKGAAYRLTPVMPHSPPVNARQPLGKIPVMPHGAFSLFESRASAEVSTATPRKPAVVFNQARFALD